MRCADSKALRAAASRSGAGRAGADCGAFGGAAFGALDGGALTTGALDGGAGRGALDGGAPTIGGLDGGAGRGALDDEPTMTNENSVTSDEDNHGVCSPRLRRNTFRLTRLKSSSIRPGRPSCLLSSVMNSGLSPSLTIVPGAAAYITAVSTGALTGARPTGTPRKRR